MNYTDTLIEEPVIVAIVGSETDETIYYIGYDYDEAKLTYENFKEPFKTTIGSVDGSCLALLEYVGDLAKFDQAVKKFRDSKNGWFVLSDFFDMDDYEIIESYDCLDEDVEESLNEDYTPDQKMEMWVKGTLNGKYVGYRKENIARCSDTKLINYAGILYRLGQTKNDPAYFRKIPEIAVEFGKRGNTSAQANVNHLYQMAMGLNQTNNQQQSSQQQSGNNTDRVAKLADNIYEAITEAVKITNYSFEKMAYDPNSTFSMSSIDIFGKKNVLYPIIEFKNNKATDISTYNKDIIDNLNEVEIETRLLHKLGAQIAIQHIAQTLLDVCDKITMQCTGGVSEPSIMLKDYDRESIWFQLDMQDYYSAKINPNHDNTPYPINFKVKMPTYDELGLTSAAPASYNAGGWRQQIFTIEVEANITGARWGANKQFQRLSKCVFKNTIDKVIAEAINVLKMIK